MVTTIILTRLKHVTKDAVVNLLRPELMTNEHRQPVSSVLLYIIVKCSYGKSFWFLFYARKPATSGHTCLNEHT